MAIGMTYEQYWDGDCEMVRAFRRSHEIRQDLENQRLWLQGMYTYQAICCVSPILRAFSKARKPTPYPSAPFEMQRENNEVEGREKSDAKAFQKMQSLMLSINKRFAEKGG